MRTIKLTVPEVQDLNTWKRRKLSLIAGKLSSIAAIASKKLSILSLKLKPEEDVIER